MFGPKFIMQQDNDHKHTANAISNNYLQHKEQEFFEVMAWPTQGPDLHIIKSVWDETKDRRILGSLHPQKICG